MFFFHVLHDVFHGFIALQEERLDLCIVRLPVAGVMNFLEHDSGYDNELRIERASLMS